MYEYNVLGRCNYIFISYAVLKNSQANVYFEICMTYLMCVQVFY